MEKSDLKEQKDKKEQIHLLAGKLYTVTLFLYLFYQFFQLIGWNDSYYSGSIIPMYVEILGCCRFLFIPLTLEKIIRSRKEGLITAALLAVAWWVSQISNVHNNLFDFLGFLLLSELSNERRMLRWNLAIRLSMIVILVAFLILDRVKLTYYDWLLLGFANTNSTSAFILFLLLLLWQMGIGKSKLLTFIVFWAFVYPIHIYEGCETVAALLFVFPIIQVIVEGISRGKHSFILKGTVVIPFILSAVSVGVMLWLASFETVPYLDVKPWRTFSQRFGNAADLYKVHGVTLLGAKEAWTLGYTTDNLFLNTLLCHGVVALIMVTGSFSWLFYRFYQKKRYDLLTVTILFSIYSVMESVPLSVFFNYVPLIVLAEKDPGKKERRRITGVVQSNRMKWIVSGVFLFCTVFGCLLTHPTEEAGRMTSLVTGWPNKTVSAPISEEEVQFQTFEATESFCGVKIYMATFHKYPILQLNATLQDETGNVVATKTIKRLVADNKYQTILFDKPIDPGRYSLGISGKTQLGSVVIWQAEGNYYSLGAVVKNGIETEYDWLMLLVNDTVFKETGRTWICTLFLILMIMIWIAPGINKPDKKAKKMVNV